MLFILLGKAVLGLLDKQISIVLKKHGLIEIEGIV